jgi:hypothetical protein
MPRGSRDPPENGAILASGAHEITQATRGFRALLTLGLAGCAPGLGSVEAHQPDVRLALMDADGVAVDDANLGGIDRLGERKPAWRRLLAAGGASLAMTWRPSSRLRAAKPTRAWPPPAGS